MNLHSCTPQRFCLAAGLLLLLALVGCQTAPTEADIFLRDAYLARDAGDREEARAQAQKAVDDGRRAREARELKAFLHREDAREALETGDPAAAKASFLLAAEAELDRIRRGRDLHAALRAADEIPLGPQEILDLIERTLREDPQNHDLQLRSAHIADELGDLDRAVAHYTWVIAADPRDMRSTLRLGMLYQDQGRYREAAAVLQRVYQAQPDNLPAAMNLIASLTELHRTDEVGPIYEELLRHFPEQPVVLSRYADFEESQGRPERAARLRRQAEAASPAIEEREEMRPLR